MPIALSAGNSDNRSMIRFLFFNFSRIDKLATQLSASTKNEIYDYLALTLSCDKIILINEVAKLSTWKQEESIKALESHLQKLIKEAMPACESAYKAECKRIDDLRAANKGNEHTVKNARKKFVWNETIL